MLIFYGMVIIFLIRLFNSTSKNRLKTSEVNNFSYYSAEKTASNLNAKQIKSEIEEEGNVITFQDVAGHKEVKKDLSFLIKFMKNSEAYRDMGARMPKGVIFYGNPGNGKTLLAKAIAGEAGVNFISASGSDFIEMYVGVGARRVRELFKKANSKAPCIVFIDEIDAIGGQRGSESNSERDQTINALLSELDGFNENDGVVVIAATNRIDMLDSALIRPGRFDRHVAIPMPDYSDRLELLELHSKNKKIASSVNLEELAKTTFGFSGADIENLLNESAIISVNNGLKEISLNEIDEAFFKVVTKGNKKFNDKDSEEFKLIAYHEAGHAICTKLLTKKGVPKVTCVGSTSGIGGVTFITPYKSGLHTKEDLINDVKISYGGRIAEFLYTGSLDMVTTGASQDIKQATKGIVNIIGEFGMDDEVGMLDLQVFRTSGEEQMLSQAKALSKKLYNDTLELMIDNKDLLVEVAEKLMEKETILEDELDEIFFKYFKTVKINK